MRRSLCGTGCLLFLVFTTIGCNEVDLYHDLSEEDANEMLVLLAEHSIKATKLQERRQNEVFYGISVATNDLPAARSLLLQHHLPRRKELGLTGVYKEKGLIPTPDEQKARYLLAVKGEIINSLERIPDVVDADVVLNIPTQDEFTNAKDREIKRPTASVVIRAKPSFSGEAAVSEAKVQQFVANAVEGLNPRDVAVIVSYIPDEGTVIRPGEVKTLSPKPIVPLPEMKEAASTDQELLGLSLDRSSKEKLKLYLLVFFVILILLSTVLIVAIVQASRMRRSLAALQGPVGSAPALSGRVVEGEAKLEEGEPPL